MPVYLDNAATTWPKPASVIAAAKAAFDEQLGNPSRGAHRFSLAALRRVEQARERLATLFGCSAPERVAFAKNATEALNLAINSIDGHIVSTEAEHNSVLRPLHRRGDFSLAPLDRSGSYSLDALKALCRPDTAAIVVAHASNLTGNVAPIAEIGRICRERGMLLVVDAAQTAGLVDIDMEAMAVDALCFTGHKALYGPQGTGGVCLGERFRPRPLIVGGTGSRTFELDQPDRPPDLLEAGTLNVHGIAALSAGVEYVLERGPRALCESANRLAARFVDGVRRIDGAVLYGDPDAADRVPIATLNLGVLDSAEAAAALADEFDIAVRAGAHCAPGLHRRFGTERRGAVRFSFSHFNTEDEVAAALAALRALSSGSRGNP